jgi:hypothetical protein
VAVYIESMGLPRRTPFCLVACLLAGGLALAGLPSQGQVLAADYTLTAPAIVGEFEPDPPTRASLPLWGAVRLGAAASLTGSGLSLEAGQKWFARAGVGSSLDTDFLSVGGGYRFAGGDSLSMHVTRQLGQDGLGLAVRYDWRRSYLRFGYEMPVRSHGLPDRLRFSAGLRF